MVHPRVTFLLFLMFLWLSNELSAQKVALVLSGGGAKGVAHAGVIKALEEHQIPIDYIVGNSMGAFIGALYASGYSSQQIDSLVRLPEFRDMATGALDQNKGSNYEIDDPSAAWVQLPFDVDRKLGFKPPTNLINPYHMDFHLMELFADASVAAGYNFDSLMIPFRCVAADIDSSKLVILKNGDLGRSIRASVSFPFYYTPVKVNNRLLFDGGMYNNFPADVADSEFAPDVIIGSKAAGNYPSPDQNDLLSQIQNMLMHDADFEMDSLNGILIEPQISGSSVFDFTKLESYVDSGYQAALKQMPDIRKLLKRDVSAYGHEEKRQLFNSKKPDFHIDTVVIKGVNKGQSIYLSRLLAIESYPLTLEEISDKFFKLFNDDKIDYIYPQLEWDTSTKGYVLILEVTSSVPFIGEFGGNVSFTRTNHAFLGLRYRNFNRVGLNLNLNGYFGNFYSGFKADSRMDISGKMPVFLGLSFNISKKDYFSNTTYFFEDPNPAFLIQNETYALFSFGVPLVPKSNLQMEVGFARTKFDYYQDNFFGRNDTADQTYFDFIATGLKYELNSLNRRQYASEGVRIRAEAYYYMGEEETFPGSNSNAPNDLDQNHNYLRMRLRYENYFETIGQLKLGLYTDAQFSNQKNFTNYIVGQFMEAPFDPIPESQTLFLEKYRSISFAGAGLRVVNRFTRRLHLRLEGYIYQPFSFYTKAEDGVSSKISYDLSEQFLMGSAAVVLHTPIGPLSVSMNYYDKSGDNISVLFNFGYLIFNRSLLY